MPTVKSWLNGTYIFSSPDSEADTRFYQHTVLRPVQGGDETTVCTYIRMELSHGKYIRDEQLVRDDGEHGRVAKLGNKQ